jgi:hypothetical protein
LITSSRTQDPFSIALTRQFLLEYIESDAHAAFDAKFAFQMRNTGVSPELHRFVPDAAVSPTCSKSSD